MLRCVFKAGSGDTKAPYLGVGDGGSQIFVEPFARDGTFMLISPRGGEELEMLPDEDTLLYGAGRNWLKVTYGKVWVVLFGTNRLAHFDIENETLREYDLPREEARPRRMEITSDGRIWYGDYEGGYLGVFDPETAEFTEWQMSSASKSRVYGMAKDETDTIWFVETGVYPNRFVGFDTRSESFKRGTDVPSGGGTIRHMYFDENTGYVWFGADSNTVGRAIVSAREGS